MASCGTTALRASNHSRAPFSSSGAQGCSGSDVLTGTFMPASHHTHTRLHTQGPEHAQQEGLGKSRSGRQGLLC